jgi:hypothetical protein
MAWVRPLQKVNFLTRRRKDFKKEPRFFALLGQKLHFCAKILFFFASWRLGVKVFYFWSARVFGRSANK